jgi:hypothetical protein
VVELGGKYLTLSAKYSNHLPPEYSSVLSIFVERVWRLGEQQVVTLMNWDFKTCTVWCNKCSVCGSVNIGWWKHVEVWPRLKITRWASYRIMTTYITGNCRLRKSVAHCDVWPNYRVANITVLTVSSCRSDRQICTHIYNNKRQENGRIER